MLSGWPNVPIEGAKQSTTEPATNGIYGDLVDRKGTVGTVPKAAVDLQPSALQSSAMKKDDLAAKITKVVESIPDWLRQDLISKDPIVRARAEETLSVMITAAVSSPDS